MFIPPTLQKLLPFVVDIPLEWEPEHLSTALYAASAAAHNNAAAPSQENNIDKGRKEEPAVLVAAKKAAVDAKNTQLSSFVVCVQK
eukprot:5331780-Ditylum_brightwellii.AAC.2